MRLLQALLLTVTAAATAAAPASPGLVPGPGTIDPPGSLPDLTQLICPAPDFLGDYPKDEELPWSENVQGVAHDDEHWFFTQQDALLRLPAGFPLHRDPDFSRSPGGELRRKLGSYGALAGFNHFGDIDQFGGFVFAPLQKPPTIARPHAPRGAIGVFAASDLQLVSVVDVTSIMGTSVGWVAIDPWKGYLYTSASHVSSAAGSALYRFAIDLDPLRDPAQPGDWLVYKDRVTLADSGGAPLRATLRHMQGGVFTPWGDLVIENGFIDDPPRVDRGGIHIFRPRGARRDATVFDLVTESVDEKGLGGFSFAYDPAFDPYSSPAGPNNDEEPEGIDWWDRGPGTAPLGAQGQLHGIMIDNTQRLKGESNPDDLYFKHYAVDDRCLPDFDNDGLSTSAEVELGTDPLTTGLIGGIDPDIPGVALG